MTNHEAVRADLKRARLIEKEAKAFHEGGAWNLVVRRCQEALEQGLKAALKWAGLEVPRVHDVGPSLRSHEDKFPQGFRSVISQLASLSRRLRLEREVSFYGDEETGTPPEALYGQEDARRALEEVGWALGQVVGLLEKPRGVK